MLAYEAEDEHEQSLEGVDGKVPVNNPTAVIDPSRRGVLPYWA